MKRIGLIGTGIMGSGMARNLLLAGFDVHVWNRTAQKCEPLVAAGAVGATSIGDLTEACDAVVLMLSDDDVVRGVITAEDGVASRARRGTVVVDSSTVHPHTSQQVAESLRRRDIAFLDAPVTGTRREAEDGSLLFVVGGDRDDYDRCRPLFEAMGRDSIHMGPHGAAAAAKLANNMMCVINLAGFGEAMATIRRFGLDPQRFFDFLSGSGGRSAMSQRAGPKILSGDRSVDFTLPMLLKDARLCVSLAEAMDVPARVIRAAADAVADACAETPEDHDISALCDWYEKARPT